MTRRLCSNILLSVKLLSTVRLKNLLLCSYTIFFNKTFIARAFELLFSDKLPPVYTFNKYLSSIFSKPDRQSLINTQSKINKTMIYYLV